MEKTNNTLDLRRFSRAASQVKWVCLAGIVLLVAAASYFSFRSLPKMEVDGKMLVGEIGNDDTKGAGNLSQMMKTFSVGGFGAATVDNEVIIMKSFDVMQRTVRALGLNRTYVGKDAEGEKAMLFGDMPVKLEAPVEYFDSLKTSFVVQIDLKSNDPANPVVDIRVVKGLFKTLYKEVKGATLPMMLQTPFGSFQVIAADNFASSPYRSLTCTVVSTDAKANELTKTLDIDVESKLSDIIDVQYDCASGTMGCAVVNGVMHEYNAKRLDRLHESAVASIKYYDERIAETFKVLQAEEQKVSDYQRKNKLMGVDSELEFLVGNTMNARNTVQTQSYNIAYYETVLDILRNRLHEDMQIPTMESLNDPNIGAFNGYIQARREMRKSATENNEVLKSINAKIEEISKLIIENSEKMIAKAKADMQHQVNLSNTAQNRLDEYPDYQLEFMNLVRDKNYQNQLYEYLVAQRENSVLQLYSSTNVGFVFQPAYVAKQAGLLKKLILPLAALVVGLILSICFIALWMLTMNRRVKAPMDLAFIGIDSRTVAADPTDPSGVNSLRTVLTAQTDTHVLYFAPIDGTTEARKQLTLSLLSIGRNVETITGLASNDEVLTPAIQQQIEAARAVADYVIVEVPDATRLADLENAIDADDAALIVSVRSGAYTRKAFKQLLKGQTADHVYCIIVK